MPWSHVLRLRHACGQLPGGEHLLKESAPLPFPSATHLWRASRAPAGMKRTTATAMKTACSATRPAVLLASAALGSGPAPVLRFRAKPPAWMCMAGLGWEEPGGPTAQLYCTSAVQQAHGCGGTWAIRAGACQRASKRHHLQCTGPWVVLQPHHRSTQQQKSQ